MYIDLKINIETFCTCSSMSFSDRLTLNKIYNKSILKTYSEWYDIISIDFVIHKNLSSLHNKNNNANKVLDEKQNIEQKKVSEKNVNKNK